jgi:hypothetical protein
MMQESLSLMMAWEPLTLTLMQDPLPLLSQRLCESARAVVELSEPRVVFVHAVEHNEMQSRAHTSAPLQFALCLLL